MSILFRLPSGLIRISNSSEDDRRRRRQDETKHGTNGELKLSTVAHFTVASDDLAV